MKELVKQGLQAREGGRVLLMPDFQGLDCSCVVLRHPCLIQLPAASSQQPQLGSCNPFKREMERTLNHLIQLFTDGEIEGLDRKCAKGLLGSQWQGQNKNPGILAPGYCLFPHILLLPNLHGFQIMPGDQQLCHSLTR